MSKNHNENQAKQELARLQALQQEIAKERAEKTQQYCDAALATLKAEQARKDQAKRDWDAELAKREEARQKADQEAKAKVEQEAKAKADEEARMQYLTKTILKNEETRKAAVEQERKEAEAQREKEQKIYLEKLQKQQERYYAHQKKPKGPNNEDNIPWDYYHSNDDLNDNIIGSTPNFSDDIVKH